MGFTLMENARATQDPSDWSNAAHCFSKASEYWLQSIALLATRLHRSDNRTRLRTEYTMEALCHEKMNQCLALATIGCSIKKWKQKHEIK